MSAADDGGRAALRAVAVAAVALAGFLFSLTPVASWLDGALLDGGWRTLRKFDNRPAADDVIVVGIDPATVSAIAEPPGLWHQPLALVLARIAAAQPRAIGLDFPLPERSYDAIRPGLDRALFSGLAAAVEKVPFVAVLTIDAHTRSAKRIYTPYLALLGESRLSVGLLAHDGDGVTRRFSLAIPTEDGAFPTLEGRLCRAMAIGCSDGLINYALGAPITYLSMKTVLQAGDDRLVAGLLRGRVVLIGEAQPYSDRVDVPVNLAGWEQGGSSSPAIVVHAQALRTAMTGTAPDEASRPLSMLLITLAALLLLVRRLAVAWACVATVGALAAFLLSLRSGLYVPMAAPLFTVWIAAIYQAYQAWRTPGTGTRAEPNIPHAA